MVTRTEQRRSMRERQPTRRAAGHRRTRFVLVLLALLSCSESPTAPVATSVTIVPRTVALVGLGASATLAAEVRDQDGQIMTGVPLVWTSSNPSVATVSAQGEVTAAGYGEAVINAAYGTAVGAAAAFVEQPIHAVVVEPANDTVVIGDSVRYRAHAIYENGDTMPNAEFVWKTSDPLVVSVEAGTGRVTGRGEGNATISASISGAEGSAGVKVVSQDWAALVALYRATDGDNWHRNQGWLSDLPIGQWLGINVDGTRVIEINLGDNNLRGQIPPEMGQLSELWTLLLYNNLLTGPIPRSMGMLHNLRQLWLWGNNLTGHIPSELGNLSSLRELSLGGNSLEGPIPVSILQLQQLSTLGLGQNRLTGSIPPAITGLTSVQWLYLGGNRLSGRIPAELGSLPELYVLQLGRNELTGNIPPELGKLTGLTHMSLQFNALTGPIPAELGNLHGTKVLDLRHNNLSGPVPAEFGNLLSMWKMYLSYNAGLSGALPRSLTSLYMLEGLWADATALCTPGDADFAGWLAGIPTKPRIPVCPAPGG